MRKRTRELLSVCATTRVDLFGRTRQSQNRRASTRVEMPTCLAFKTTMRGGTPAAISLRMVLRTIRWLEFRMNGTRFPCFVTMRRQSRQNSSKWSRSA
jgi:hypothetical protein